MPADFPPAQQLIRLDGKGAMVTGGATGIGFAISRRLAEAGAAVAIVDVDAKKGQQASAELRGYGYRAECVAGDVSREEAVRGVVRAAAEKIGSLDILVNNAGIYPRIPLAEMTEKDFQRVISVNLTGTFLCSREVSQRMREQGRGGCIINIASIDAVHPAHEGMAAYDASKGGVLTLTKSLAHELGKHDIRVNAIAPGAIMSEGIRSVFTGPASNQGKAELKSFMSRMVLGRMGEVDEIGRVALFLASDLASYITGTLIVADGGYLIG